LGSNVVNTPIFSNAKIKVKYHVVASAALCTKVVHPIQIASTLSLLLMNITEKAKEELENRVQKLARFIEKKGVGSLYLNRAKKVQKTANIAILMGAVVTIAGGAIWAISKLNQED